jgi:hypothetical protein
MIELEQKTGKIYKRAIIDHYLDGSPNRFEFIKDHADSGLLSHVKGLMQDEWAYCVKYNGHTSEDLTHNMFLRRATEYTFSYYVLLVNPAECALGEHLYFPFNGDIVLRLAGKYFTYIGDNIYICE